ncbi:MAG: hypothetical protein KF718_08520 [Polyangiaceae bacterium]|nr:hypothetical protein [Polyangiaceae bacterium]
MLESPMVHTEERQFSLTLHLCAEFDPSYDGEQDGYAWHARFERDVMPQLVRAVFDVLRTQPGYEVIAAPRGRPSGDALDIAVRVVPRDG